MWGRCSTRWTSWRGSRCRTDVPARAGRRVSSGRSLIGEAVRQTVAGWRRAPKARRGRGHSRRARPPPAPSGGTSQFGAPGRRKPLPHPRAGRGLPASRSVSISSIRKAVKWNGIAADRLAHSPPRVSLARGTCASVLLGERDGGHCRGRSESLTASARNRSRVPGLSIAAKPAGSACARVRVWLITASSPPEPRTRSSKMCPASS